MKKKNGNPAAQPLRLVAIEEGAERRDPTVVCRLVEMLHELRRKTGVTPRATQHAGHDCWSLTIEHRTGLVNHVLTRTDLHGVVCYLQGAIDLAEKSA